MRIALFYHSLLSDWNHGNAHFLRGITRELLERGHQVRVFEPCHAWSLENLQKDHGQRAIRQFHAAYPSLASIQYDRARLDLEKQLAGTDLIVAHEWNDVELIRSLGDYRRRHRRCRLLFHDTHHRSVTDPAAMAAYDLSACDGVLAFGSVIRDLYLERRWARRAWTWHEAADPAIARPIPGLDPDGDLVWIGNWGDAERSEELRTYLLLPAARLKLRAKVHGVRYPPHALAALRASGIRYSGWLPNFFVANVFARHRLTVHIPRRPYATALPGIPTIRPFEAMACGIPLISSPWRDAESLFRSGKDYLMAHDGEEMCCHMRSLLEHPAQAAAMADHGRQTILSRHTCAHRVAELLLICQELGLTIQPSDPVSLQPQTLPC